MNRHKVGALIADAAQQAKRRAKRDPKGDEILSALEPAITYVAAPAKKAAATKAKKNAAKKSTPAGGRSLAHPIPNRAGPRRATDARRSPRKGGGFLLGKGRSPCPPRSPPSSPPSAKPACPVRCRWA